MDTIQTIATGFKGFNNNIHYSTMQPDQLGKVWLLDCNNIVISDSGRVERILGKELSQPVAQLQSLTSFKDDFVYVSGNVLNYKSYTYTLRDNFPVTYQAIQNKLFFSNGFDVGYISTSGIFANPAGTYTGLATVRKFHNGIMPGGILAYCCGRLLSAAGNTVWLSEPRNPFLFSLSDARFTYKTDVRLLACFESSFWLSDSEGIYFIRFNGEHWQQEKKAGFPALRGEAVFVDLSELPLETIAGVGYIFPTTAGICCATSEGFLINLTSNAVEFKDSAGNALGLTHFKAAVKNNKIYFHLWGVKSLGIVLNIKTLAVTKHTEFLFNSVCELNGRSYGGFSAGIYSLFSISPQVDSFFTLSAVLPRTSRVRRVRLHGEFNANILLVVTCDDAITKEYITQVKVLDKQKELQRTLRRDNGIGTYWKFKVSNTKGAWFSTNSVHITTVNNRRVL